MARELRGAMAALFTCTDGEVLVEGRAGTAKTTGVLTKLIHDCETYPGCRVLVCRRTRKSLTNSVMVTFDRLVPPRHPAYREVRRANRDSNDWPNGSTIVWGGLDNPEGLFSTEWDRIYVCEATEITLDAWDLFGRSMRSHKTPYHQRIADCNPSYPNHWLNGRATPCPDSVRDAFGSRDSYNGVLQVYNHHTRIKPDHPMRRLVSVHQDNPGYWDFARWDWTDFGREYVEGVLAGMSGHRRARMYGGRWKAAEGGVFPEFDDERHVIGDFEPPPDWPVYLGWDPGYDHPTAILWLAVAPNGCLYIFDEIYQGGLGVADHCANIKRRNFGNGRSVRGYYGDPQHILRHTADSTKSIAEQAAECGITMLPWPRSTDVEAMVNTVRERLVGWGETDVATGIWTAQRKPMIKVCRRCVNTIGEFQSWRYKRVRDGELPAGDDQFEDKANHTMDVVKGMCSLPVIATAAADGKFEVYG